MKLAAFLGLCFLTTIVSGRTSPSTTNAWDRDRDADYSDDNMNGNRVVGAGAAGVGMNGDGMNGDSCEAGPMYITTQAVAAISGDGQDVSGTIQFDQSLGAGPVFITGAVSGLSKGNHAIRIQEYGNIRDGCNENGGDYNPDGYANGGPNDAERHAGNLGNINANYRGTATINTKSSAFSLNGDYSIIGRAVVIYQNEDMYNNGTSSDTADLGEALACGVIGIAAQEINPQYDQKANANSLPNRL